MCVAESGMSVYSLLSTVGWVGGKLPFTHPPSPQLKERTRIEIERRGRGGDGREINRERGRVSSSNKILG